MDIWNENCVSVSTISGSHADTVDTREECGDVCIDQSEDENHQSRNVGLALSIWIFRYLATPTCQRTDSSVHNSPSTRTNTLS